MNVVDRNSDSVHLHPGEDVFSYGFVEDKVVKDKVVEDSWEVLVDDRVEEEKEGVVPQENHPRTPVVEEEEEEEEEEVVVDDHAEDEVEVPHLRHHQRKRRPASLDRWRPSRLADRELRLES